MSGTGQLPAPVVSDITIVGLGSAKDNIVEALNREVLISQETLEQVWAEESITGGEW